MVRGAPRPLPGEGRARARPGGPALSAPRPAARLHAEAIGAGAPTVVLVHAKVADSGMWAPQWDSLAGAHRLLRYDQRGFGRSPAPTGAWSDGQDLLDLLDAWELGRVAFVAASGGATVALEVAVAAPERVSALVLADAALPDHDWSAALVAFGEEEDAALERGDVDAATEANLRTWLDRPQRADARVREPVAAMQRRFFAQILPVLEAAEPVELVEDLGARLGEIRVPTLVVVGAHDQPDMLVIAERLAREVPGAAHAVVEGAAHLPSLERPEAFDALVVPFLARALA